MAGEQEPPILPPEDGPSTPSGADQPAKPSGVEPPPIPPPPPPEAARVELSDEERERLKQESLDAIVELQELSTRLMDRLPADAQERLKGDEQFFKDWIPLLRSPEALTDSQCEAMLKSIDGIRIDINWLREFETNNPVPETPLEPAPPAPEEQASITELTEEELNELKADYLSDIAKLQNFYEVHASTLSESEQVKLEPVMRFYTRQRERLESNEPLAPDTVVKLQHNARRLKETLEHFTSLLPARPPIPERFVQQTASPPTPTEGAPEQEGALTERQGIIAEAIKARRDKTEQFVNREMRQYLDTSAARLAGRAGFKRSVIEWWSKSRLQQESDRLRTDIRLAKERLDNYEKRYSELEEKLQRYRALAETRPALAISLHDLMTDIEPEMVELPGLIEMQKALLIEYSKSLRLIAGGAGITIPAVPEVDIQAGIPEIAGSKTDEEILDDFDSWSRGYEEKVGRLFGAGSSSWGESGSFPEGYLPQKSGFEKFFRWLVTGTNDKPVSVPVGGKI